LGYAVDPRILFPPEYPYTSGTTRILRQNFAQLYEEVNSLVGLRPDDLIVDIGSNDGTLLGNFLRNGHRVAGVEPSLTARLAEEKNIPTIMAYFERSAVDQVRSRFGEPRVTTATNVFAHIHDVRELMENITNLVGSEGVFITESHYLGDLVETLQYDTIYHEHLRYYSLTSIQALLNLHGFRIFNVVRIPTHGGSIRVYASRSNRYPPNSSVERLLSEERSKGLAGPAWIADFRSRVLRSKLDLYELLSGMKRKNAKIFGIGAPSRASTLINYVGLDDGVMDCVMEVKGSLKIGKYVPGRNIPVLEESRLYSEQPEYALMLSWHIASELCSNIKRNGYRGDFIIPLPQPTVVSNESVR
jgi:hypothetical protein